MTAPRDPAALLAILRGHAANGEWTRVRALVAEHEYAASDGDLMMLAAEAELRLGEPRPAAARLRAAIAYFERRGDGASLRRATNLLGAAAFELGDLEESRSAFARAVEMASADGDHLLVARATNNLGAIANLRGERETALAHFQLAIPAYQQLGHTVGLAESCHNIAIAYRDARRLREAEEYERRALEYAQDAGSETVAAMARTGRAELSLLSGDPRLAEIGAEMAAREYRRLNDPIGEADALRLVGEARAVSGDLGAAMPTLNEAIRLAELHGAALVRAEALRARAAAHALREDFAAARMDALAAQQVFEQLGATEELARTGELLARLAR